MINTPSSDIATMLEPFLNQITKLTGVVQALQAQVNELRNQILTPSSTQWEQMSKDNLIQEFKIDMTSLTDSKSPASRSEKSEKYLNLLMYDNNWKNLYPFITKL